MNNPSSSFTFLPSNPNPNFFHQQPPFTHQPTTVTTAGAINLPPDLPTSLSALKHLIQLSETTIQSISTLFHSNSTAALSTCPFNPHHRLPPHSLFRHYLHCPSSPATIQLSLLDSLHYPISFQSSEDLISENKPFIQTLNSADPNADLCFSLDEYPTSLDSNFFYEDCPGVVTFPDDQDNTSRLLTLPVILSAECANFNGGVDVIDIDGLSTNSVAKLLPSEIWSARNEITAWNDYPTHYSSCVLKLILFSYMSRSCELKDWLITISPRYGIVIDLPMMNHIHLLFRVCVKAIAKDAFRSLGLLSRVDQSGCKFFECPVVVRVLVWLASQLSVLYGEADGRLFAIDMFKQSLLFASSSFSMFSDERKDRVCSDLGAMDEKCDDRLKESSAKQEKTTWVIFVSQIAAAVAALHERATLETKIKGIRYTRPLTNYQRVAEHGFESKIADEQRQKRSNFRPILEHDGILSQRERDKETNRMKSREELLAEERDYKRRRTSYRGKKIKRNTTHVMRDIIEEYMEEIKQAGGIGCLVKGTGETKMGVSEAIALHDTSTDIKAMISAPTSSEVHSSRQRGNRQSESEAKMSASTSTDLEAKMSAPTSTRIEDESPERNTLHRHDSYSDRWRLEPYSRDKNRNDRAYSGDRNRNDRAYSRNDDGERGKSDSYEKLDRGSRYGNKIYRKYLSPSPDRDHSRSREQRHHDRTRKTVERKESYEKIAHRKGRSDSVVHNEIEDRYDPSIS